MIKSNFKIGERVIVIRNIPTVDGMLREGEKVKIDEVGFPDKDLRVKDDLGKIWYVNYSDIER
tara:strand:- start:21729 stop:21917 length:189 start_codon:yes stop_codon:yes gene_type:complete